jgi:uncharacterized FlaG/YvyC family protein
MDINSVNMKEFTISDAKNNQSVDHDNHISDKVSVQASNNAGESTIEFPIQTKAVLAIDDDKNVVIQLLDKDGKVVRQMPPEDYLDMVKKLKEVIKSHYDIEA